jgi:Xaa-Pro aminopeptidase
VRVEVNDIIQRAVRPGRSFNEVLTEVKAFVEESGCVMPKNNLGHGIGLEIHEPPRIGLSSEIQPYSGSGMPGYPKKFEVGMVFTLEPNIRDPELNVVFNCEDDVVVTETGSELLTELSREMQIKI